MTDQMFFDMPCPRCRQTLKVVVNYNSLDTYPFNAGDLGGHHPQCSRPPGLHALGASPAQSLKTLQILLLPAS